MFARPLVQSLTLKRTSRVLSNKKAHQWFKNVDWLALREQRIRPPWVPARMKPGDTGCFLVWKTEPEVSEKEQPSEQVQEYSRIKMPAGCALRAPQPQKGERLAAGVKRRSEIDPSVR